MLEKLFTSKNRVKILNFFLFEKSESYIREISRNLEVSVSAVKKEVDNLLLTGILKKRKSKISLNKNCTFLGDLRNIFIKTDAIIYPLKKIIEKNKKIKYALVFGSFAKGEYKEKSDVDLMIIGDIKLGSVIRILEPVEKKIGRDINPVVWTIENLKKEKDSSFIKDIVKKGVTMVKGEKNEFQRIIR